MITQQDSGGDGRGQMLELTDVGRATVPVLAMIADQNDGEFFGELGPDTRAFIVSTMREIVRRRGSRAAPAD